MSWLFIGPTLLAGIGQVTKKYLNLLQKNNIEVEYVQFGQTPLKQKYDRGFAFVLPIQAQLDFVDEYIKLCAHVIFMTVCETLTVHPTYELLEKYKTIYCPSEFARDVLAKQFPKTEWKLLRHYAAPKALVIPASSKYVFYTIGNAHDPRKNLKDLVYAFMECGFGDAAHLIIKATTLEVVDWKANGLTVINGLLSDEDLEKVHNGCHCYVNCSHSEGVGMGAVEAAIRSKPVIISDFGGLKEYVKTPWVIPAPVGKIGFDDFLFTKELEWGYPSKEELKRCMKECFDQRVTHWDHSHTRAIMSDLEGLSWCTIEEH